MELGAAALLGAGVSAAAAAGAAALVVWAGPLDRPRARGSHARPTVTSGGLAILVAAALGLLTTTFVGPVDLRTDLARVSLALAFAGALGLLGVIDDLFDVGARTKLILQALAGLTFAAMVARPETVAVAPGLTLVLAPVVAVLGATLWLVVATNAVNFMDGANGLAAGCVAIAFAALAGAGFAHGQPALAAAALTASAAVVGFLPWNLPAGRLFQGDVGALFCGFLLAALAVVAATTEPGRALSLYVVPFALTPILTDVLLTLVVRAARGASLMQAHRDHLYQVWLTRTGRSHAALAARAWGLTAVYAGVGLAAEFAAPGWQGPLFIVGAGACVAGWVAARRRLTR
jgi:UDP-N-acetylmuramyl pentapeptide phosphotransferase/UDP-N-acetylglucosamine-1-phosphate transferase